VKKYLLFYLFLLHPFTAQGAGVNLEQGKILTCNKMYSACPTCIDNQWLLPFEKFSNSADSIEVEADKSEIIDKDNYLITGNVILRNDSHFLSADKVRISKTDKSSNASGNVKYQDKHFFVTSDELNVHKENDDLLLNAGKAKFQEIKTKANGSAEKIIKNQNYAVLDESKYSMCPINDNTWYIKAKKINLDLNTNRVIADKATLVFFDFPIFYLPKYSWISQGRGSGFLTPSFNIYKESGLESSDWLIRAPYYINIAPDKDLLISPAYLSSRGALYQGKFRQLIDPSKSKDHGLFEFEFKYLNDDYIDNINRWLTNTSMELDLSGKTHLSLRYNKVSDPEFFKEVARDGNSDERLNSHVKFTYNNPPLPLERNNVEFLSKSNLEKLSDSELIQMAIDSGNADKIKFTNEALIDAGLTKEEVLTKSNIEKLSDSGLIQKDEDLANREELIVALVEITQSEALTEGNLEKLSHAGLAKIEFSDKVDEDKTIKVNYDRNIIGNGDTNHLSFAISSKDEQVVNDGTPEYEKKLETSIFSRLVNDDSKLDLSFISTNFNHKTTGKETGIRTHGEVNFNKKLGTLRPIDISRLSTDARLAISHYALDNKANETRVIGGFDIDLSFPFSSKTTLFGPETTNQIIPMISYDFTSKQKQASIPIFDTTDGIDGYLEHGTLLSGDRYNGIDRFVNENDITLSLQSIYKDRLDKNSELIFKLAQRYYGDAEVVSDTENIDFETRRKYSDIFASAELSVNNFDIYAKLQYDPKNFSLSKNRIGFNYKPNPRKFISLVHKDDDSERSLELSGSYPITNKIHIFAGIDKSLTSGVISEETTGIAYESCCWAARLAHFKTSDSLGYDYGTGLELVFKDLGTTDTYVRNKIEKRLPEYKVILD
jgi:lipopolysaccharide assembly outer membrane protein LptD (OstA)